MKIISWNVNGIRAVNKKGFYDWFKKTKPDILCLQEIKAEVEKIPPELLKINGYYSYFNPAEKKGYSGLAVYSKQEPLEVDNKLGFSRFDSEGRFLNLKFKNFSLINLYMPQGGRAKENLDYKLEVYDFLLSYLKQLKDQKIIIAGDFNIASTELDLARPKENKNNTMFTPEEREKIEKLSKLGFVDSFRKIHPNLRKYSWWPYFYNARERNLGWRIDYIFISKKLVLNVKKANIETAIKGSDHCPVSLDIDL